MTPMKKFYRQQGTTIIQNLKKRNMSGYYCETAQEAKDLALTLIAPESTIGFGGSMTLEAIGLLDTLASGSYHLLDRSTASTPDEVRDIYLKSFGADTFLMSTNAISLDGHLVNIDGNGNRVAALIYGPTQVLILCGMNKVASTLDEAIERVKNFAAPPNTQRLSRNTPCSKTGFCHDCQAEDCICSNIVITRRSNKESRIKVILIGEALGY
jgi:L-lactate utilization protein LutB